MTQPRHYDLNHTSIWAKLHQHQRATRHMHMRELFAADPERFARFSLSLGPLLMDYSKHRITERTLELLFELAHAARLGDWRQRMRAGERINVSEQRAVGGEVEQGGQRAATRWARRQRRVSPAF